MTFKTPLERGEIDLERLLEWGKRHRFSWVEIRDFDLSFTRSDMEGMKRLANAHGLRAHYAWNTTSVADASTERFLRGIENAACLGFGTYSRVVIAPECICASQGKFGYSPKDLKMISERMTFLTEYALKRGTTLVFENGVEPLRGPGSFEAVLEAVPGMAMTLDIANPFNQRENARVTSWPQLREFIYRWRQQIPYVHLKSSKNNEVIPDLVADGDAPLSDVLSLLDPSALLCVEVPGNEYLNSCFTRVAMGGALVRDLLSRAPRGDKPSSDQ